MNNERINNGLPPPPQFMGGGHRGGVRPPQIGGMQRPNIGMRPQVMPQAGGYPPMPTPENPAPRPLASLATLGGVGNAMPPMPTPTNPSPKPMRRPPIGEFPPQGADNLSGLTRADVMNPNLRRFGNGNPPTPEQISAMQERRLNKKIGNNLYVNSPKFRAPKIGGGEI